MNRLKIFISISSIITAITVVLIIKELPVTPRNCATHYTLKFEHVDSHTSTLAHGTMLVQSYGGKGTAAFTGVLVQRENESVQTRSVNRIAYYTYNVMGHSFVTHTTGSNASLNDGITNEDAYKYIYSGFRDDSYTHGTLMKVNSREFASGENLYPRALCTPIEGR